MRQQGSVQLAGIEFSVSAPTCTPMFDEMRQSLVDVKPELSNRCTYVCQSAHRFTCRFGARRRTEVSAGPCADSRLNRMAMATIGAGVMLSVESRMHKERHKKPPLGANERDGDPASRGESSPMGLLHSTRMRTFNQSQI